jgi:hypothetical protein
MTSPLMNGPLGDREQIKSAPAPHTEQQEEYLLEEFARLMRTEVSAVRLLERAADIEPGEAEQASPLRAIAVEQIAKQGSKRVSLGDAGAASTEASPETRDELPVTSSDARRSEARSKDPSQKGQAPEEGVIVAPRKSGRATLTLGVVFAIGVAGVIGAWVFKIAPGVRAAPVIEMAADELSKLAPRLQDAVFSIKPMGQAGEPNPVGLPSSAEHSSETQQLDKSPPAASLAAASPEPSGEAIVMSSVPVIRSIAPTDASPVPATAAGQTAAPAAASGFLPGDPEQVKAGLASQGGSVIADKSASATDANRSPKVAEAPVLPPPSNAPPQPANAPVPLARPSFNSSTNGAPEPVAHKIGVRLKSSSKPIDHAPNPKIGATIGNSSPPLDLATDPGMATAPVVAKALSETPSSTESPLQFVPNLFEKGVSAVRGFVGDASRGS